MLLKQEFLHFPDNLQSNPRSIFAGLQRKYMSIICNSNSNWTFIALNLPKQEDSKAQQNKNMIKAMIYENWAKVFTRLQLTLKMKIKVTKKRVHTHQYMNALGLIFELSYHI